MNKWHCPLVEECTISPNICNIHVYKCHDDSSRHTGDKLKGIETTQSIFLDFNGIQLKINKKEWWKFSNIYKQEKVKEILKGNSKSILK